MEFEYKKVKVANPPSTATDPVEVFQGAKVSDPMINDLWLAQGDALRAWHEHRNEPDVSVQLNTGAGKTLVGLLVAQSLVNETKGFVLYACGSIQLVKQTAAKARGYGLPSTTYITGNYSNDNAHAGLAPCITTYQALLNGHTVFSREDVTAVVFDDAHVAGPMIRDAFSVDVRHDMHPSLCNEMLSIFEDYFHSVDKIGTFNELRDGEGGSILLVPPSEVLRKKAAVINALMTSDDIDDKSLKFAWNHLKDHVDLCAFVISASGVSITPPFPPIHTLPYFATDVRRVYLSATLADMDVFARTFGRIPNRVIAPTTTAGECERMILVPSYAKERPRELDLAQEIIAPHKSLVLVPTYARAKKWEDTVTPPEREDAAADIEAFKADNGPAKLILVQRYDGLDLPGDTCRVMVVDDLPSSAGPFERYLWEFLGMQNSLRSTVASRIVQSFGRISRGMSDHGVVLVTGKALVSWLRSPKFAGSLPHFVQKQMKLGIELSREMTAAQMIEAPSACLSRDPDWIEAYATNMQEITLDERHSDSEAAIELALAEAKFGKRMWSREYGKACRALQAIFDRAVVFSDTTAAWYMLWAGYALELDGDSIGAQTLYRRAAGFSANLPRLRPELRLGASQVSEQILRIADHFEISASAALSAPPALATELAALKGESSAQQTEEAIKNLGRYLGMVSTRPDKEFGTGPDNLWLADTDQALVLDAKTDKQPDSKYSKKELGSLADHYQWTRANYDVDDITVAFIGPLSPASEKATPSDEVMVATLSSLNAIAELVKGLYRDAAKACNNNSLVSFLETEVTKRGLRWPSVLERFEFRRLVDL